MFHLNTRPLLDAEKAWLNALVPDLVHAVFDRIIQDGSFGGGPDPDIFETWLEAPGEADVGRVISGRVDYAKNLVYVIHRFESNTSTEDKIAKFKKSIGPLAVALQQHIRFKYNTSTHRKKAKLRKFFDVFAEALKEEKGHTSYILAFGVRGQ